MIPTALQTRLAVPGATDLLDGDRLSEILGRRIEVRHVRVKPGRSLLVAWSGLDDADQGWAMSVTDPAKVAGLLRRAERAAGTLRDHGGGLFSGDIATDPRLARPIRHALGRTPVPEAGDVLRYNPGRRLVLRTRDAAQPIVLRVATRSLSPLVAVSRRWAALGVPTLPNRRWRRHDTAAVADLWGTGDLSVRPSPAVARACGEAVARLHAVPVEAAFAVRPGPPAVPGPVHTGAIASLLPHLGPVVTRLSTGLRRTLPTTPLVPCHGDLSPDQVLTAGTGFRIIDLDRAGAGHPGADVGAWLAWCELHDMPGLADAFREGYAGVAPLPASHLWRARALLACAIDPFRRASGDWPERMEDRVRASERAFAAGEREAP